jgi:hypothetical protein
LLISNIFSFISICLLYILIKFDFGNIIAKRSSIYFLFFPVAYFFSVMYTESLFMTLMLLTFYYSRRENWLLVGIFGFFATLTRMFGLILFFPMIYLYFKRNNFKKFDYKIIWLGLIPLAILFLYSYFFFTTGDFFAQQHEFSSWNFHNQLPGQNLLISFIALFSSLSIEAYFYYVLNLIFGLLFIIASIYSFRLRTEYGIFMVIYFLLATAHETLNANLRYFWLMFPAYILLASVRNPKFHYYMRYFAFISLSLMILFTIRHVNKSIRIIEIINYYL